jgi:hypothetical protein
MAVASFAPQNMTDEPPEPPELLDYDFEAEDVMGAEHFHGDANATRKLRRIPDFADLRTLTDARMRSANAAREENDDSRERERERERDTILRLNTSLSAARRAHERPDAEEPLRRKRRRGQRGQGRYRRLQMQMLREQAAEEAAEKAAQAQQADDRRLQQEAMPIPMPMPTQPRPRPPRPPPLILPLSPTSSPTPARARPLQRLPCVPEEASEEASEEDAPDSKRQKMQRTQSRVIVV